MSRTSRPPVKLYQRQTWLSGETSGTWNRDSADRGSLLPAPMHTSIANHCIQHHKHLVTASYVSEEMQALNDQ